MHPNGHLGVDLGDDGLKQSLLVAEMVIERAARQPGRGGEIVHRRFRIADRAESMAGRRDQLGARLGDHLLAWFVHLWPYSHTSRILFDIRSVCTI